MASKKGLYKVQFENNQICINKSNGRTTLSEPVEKKLNGVVKQDENKKFVFVPDCVDEACDSFISEFVNNLIAKGLTNKNIDKIIEMCGQLVVMQNKMFESTFQKNGHEIDIKSKDALEATTKYSCTKLKEVHSDYLRKKHFKSNKFYVEPEEKRICLKWAVKRIPEKDLHFDKFKQGTFQIVKISKTLKALFSHTEFKKLFFEYNATKHECVNGIYKRYCCGTSFKDSPHFQSNKNAIHIQIGFDEFETCCALKPKGTLHKVLGVYFKILNMPPKYLSKLNNIFLVLLCESINFQTNSIDVVMNEIIDDLLTLEKDGIKIDENSCVKVMLTSLCADNLGANVALGFSESHSATYFCRKCTMSKSQTQKATKENAEFLRTDPEYKKVIEELKINPKLDLKETKGINRECVFNKLSSYNVLSNPTFDEMHDVKEGNIQFFLTNFFEYCIGKDIFHVEDLVRRIRDFNYGYLNSRNKPSKLKITRLNLGQNATQCYCIVKHLPYIFYDKYDELKAVWPIMLNLLKSLTIIYSKEIHESNIINLEKYSHLHLSGSMKIFKKPLKPKGHYFTHYPNQIRQMGPLIEYSMMQYEAKHAFFTNIARKTNNFVNIAKTLAEKHQLIMCNTIHSFKDEINISTKSYPITKCCEFVNYKNHVEAIESISDHFVTKFVKVNGYVYRKGLMLVENFEIFEIAYVTRYQNEPYILCQMYDLVKYEKLLNSIKIEKKELGAANIKLLKISELENNQPFEKKICNDSIYLYVENLSVYNQFN